MSAVPSKAVAADSEELIAPYRGLRPFRFADREIFFAREKEIRKLARFVTIYRGVLLFGDSGSGKSSLVNAGLVPSLMDEGFTPDRLRIQPRDREEIIVERMQLSESAKEYLPSNFVGGQLSTGDDRIVFGAAELSDRVQRSIKDGRYPLLVFDQFEELITLFEESTSGSELQQRLAIQKKLIDSILTLLATPTLEVKVLFVFREDYLAKLAKLFAGSPDLTDHGVRLVPPEKSKLEAIIRGPFKRFPGKFKNEFPQSLIEKLSEQVLKNTDSEYINPSEIQLACLILWESAKPEELLNRLGVSGILQEHLSNAIKALPEHLQASAIALLNRMVTSAGTRNVISEEDLLVLARKETREPPSRLKEALRQLVETTRLVRKEQRHETFFYQVISEFLIDWIKKQKEVRLRAQTRRNAFKLVGLVLAIAGASVGGMLYVLHQRTISAIQDAQVAGLNQLLQAKDSQLTSLQSLQQAQTAASQGKDDELRRLLNSATAANTGLSSSLNEVGGRLKTALAENASLASRNQSLSDELKLRADAYDKQVSELQKTLSANAAELNQLRTRGIAQQGPPPSLPASVPLGVTVQLLEVYPIQDGTAGKAQWEFRMDYTVYDPTGKQLAAYQAGIGTASYDDDLKTPIVPKVPATSFTAPENGILAIKVTGGGEKNALVDGGDVVFVRSLRNIEPATVQALSKLAAGIDPATLNKFPAGAQSNGPAIVPVAIPVMSRDNPKRGAFIFKYAISTRPAAAGK